ncbi:hypothetical protein [Thalassorhabdomicrobium marinisediminis]|uniref:DUF2066 domain-containing protein n=1 Tax=Thalassorhabdomicrobium marinisediminis TaxID=2170577 RepID=A0A2T7FXL7_9RHOB|nr:hypothetical protein [Thalassorhabdomicrobium marinisediminis]PVA06909.1 hypothetical protein DC363_07095 [Thalassorhabdomicrobium marinisediminis]
MKGLALIAALIAAPLLAQPVAAQDRMTAAHCTDSWAALAEITGVPAEGSTAAPDNEGWCVVENYHLQGAGQQRWQLGQLRWRATDIARFIDDDLPPRALEVRGRNLTMVPQTDDPVLAYALSLQAEPVVTQFRAALRWDGLQNALVVDEALLVFDEGNRLSLTARFEGVNFTNSDTMAASLQTVGLRSLTMSATFGGWFERLLGLPLALSLLEQGETPPAAQVDTLKSQAVSALGRVSRTTLTDASRAALVKFIESLPRPRGTARVQISANPRLDAARMRQVATLQQEATDAQIGEALAGVSVQVNWTPASPAK